MVRLLASALALVSFFGTVSVAHAERVIVLGIRTIEGDDDVARSLTDSIREAAQTVTDWEVAEEGPPLAQLLLVHGCDEPDAACMAAIADDLQKDRVIYATIRRTGVGDEFDFSISLNTFNAQLGRIEHTMTDTIPRSELSRGELEERAGGYLDQIIGGSEVGTLRVHTEPGAEVYLDGELAGTADGSGWLEISPVGVGEHSVRVTHSEFAAGTGDVSVQANGRSELNVPLTALGAMEETPEEESSGPSIIPGLALMGVGAALAVPAFIFWSRHQAFDTAGDECRNNGNCSSYEGDVQLYANRVSELINDYNAAEMVMRGSGNSNVTPCSREDSGIDDICSDISRDQTLNIVFGVAAGLTFAAGTALLVHALMSGDEENSEASNFQLMPYGSTQEAGFTARLQF